MIKRKKQQRAQSLGEYTLVISMVVLAVVAMSLFIQRNFSARINDTRGYMLKALDQDIKNVHAARGGTSYSGIVAEYEPYYELRDVNVESNSSVNVSLNGVKSHYTRVRQDDTVSQSMTKELAAKNDDYKPSKNLSTANSANTGGWTGGGHH